MDDLNAQRKGSGIPIWGVVFAAIVVLWLLGTLFSAINPVGTDDAGTSTSCRHFRSTASDYSRGTMTRPELRERLHLIDQRGRVSNDAAIRRHAEGMLREVTTGTEAGLSREIREFGRACDRLGH